MLSMSISLVAVFFPVLLMGGHGGAHLPRIRRDPDHRHHHVADRVADRHADDVRLSGFHGQRRPELADALVAPRPSKRMQDFYRRTLTWSLDNPKTIMVMLLVAVVLNVYLLGIVPKGFFPDVDNGMHSGRHPRRPEHLLPVDAEEIPAVRRHHQSPIRRWRRWAALPAARPTNTGNVFVTLKPPARARPVPPPR